jgi:hypothetical protein
MTKRTPKRILPRISKPDESPEQCTKTLLKGRACDFEVSSNYDDAINDDDTDSYHKCGKPAVVKVQRAHGSAWLCTEHFELLSLFRSFDGRAVKAPSNIGG